MRLEHVFEKLKGHSFTDFVFLGGVSEHNLRNKRGNTVFL